MSQLPSGITTGIALLVIVLAFVLALVLQNWTVDLLLGLAGVVAAVVVIAKPRAHA